MTDEIENVEEFEPIRKKDLLSTGSTLLNLALTETPFGGFIKGKHYLVVGDSAAGKTLWSMTLFAEAHLNPQFKGYRLIYDNVEDGMLMDLDNLFSEEMADRIEPPKQTKDGDPIYSETIEDFYFNIDDLVKKGDPFIYILDSMDSLGSEASDKKFTQQKTAHHRRAKVVSGEAEASEKEDKAAGSYGDGKAKKNSEYLRKAKKGLRATGSILIILSQTRDDIGSMFAGAKTRSGGRSLRFYATTEVWMSVAKRLKRTVNKIERDIGSKVKVAVRKNQITGKLADVEIDIYHSFGIDDLGSCVDYLLKEGYWEQGESGINCKGLIGMTGQKDKVIRIIEKKGLEDEVRRLCGKCWAEVQAACQLKRKNRYQTTGAE